MRRWTVTIDALIISGPLAVLACVFFTWRGVRMVSDPVSLPISRDVGTMYLLARQFDVAIGWYHKALELDPNLAVTHWQLALAIEGHALARAKRRAEALDVLERLNRLSATRYVTPKGLAAIHTALGRHDQAFEALERSFQEREGRTALRAARLAIRRAAS